MVVLPILIRVEIACEAPVPGWCSELMAEHDGKACARSEPSRGVGRCELDGEQCEKARGRRSCNSISIETFEQVTNLDGTNDKHVEDDSCEKVPFLCGHSHIENTEGLLHIFKPRQEEEKDGPNQAFGRVLCMIGVPSCLTSQNILEFLSPFGSNLMHIRFLRDSTPNSYMVLLKFKDEASAAECHSFISGRQFNSIESHTCCAVYVSKIEVVMSNKGGSLPIPDYVELPRCTVCLERLDENVLGLLTIPCNHSFHASCMKHWSDSTCPVCRHSITPCDVEVQHCPICGRRNDLWICLICGHVGCGRYANGHAYQHFKETQHTFALELGGQRVWDYAGDNYVHRLVQTKSDGKLVEINREAMDESEKVEALNLEYSYLLSREMEMQRQYYENLIDSMQNQSLAATTDLQSKIERLKGECSLAKGEISSALNQKKQFQQKYNEMKAQLERAEHLLKEERGMNESLRANQVEFKEALQQLKNQLANLQKARDEEVSALKDEIRDLLVHIESAAQLASYDASNDVREGHITLPTAPQSNVSNRRIRRRNGR